MTSYSSNLEVMEEVLVINKKPCPGLQVFKDANCLRYFSKESILEKHLGSTDSCFDSLVFSALHHLVSDPRALFYLMSVCPDEEVVEVCRSCWQYVQKFTVSAYDVIHVFLNWGATLESLGIDDDPQLCSCFPPIISAASRPNFPAPHNIKAVLDVIPDCLSNEEGNDADKHRYDLVKVLATASLDQRHRQHQFRYQQAIYKVLESFPDWTFYKVSELVKHLRLLRMGLQNAAYVCCSFFTSSPRVRDFKVVAIRHLLHSRYGLLPPVKPFESLLENLPPTVKIVERFRLLEIYVLIQLLNTLLMTCSQTDNQPTSCINITDLHSSMASIKELRFWAEAVHSELMVPKFVGDLEGGFVREKCTRLQADCVELVCVLKKDKKQWQNAN